MIEVIELAPARSLRARILAHLHARPMDARELHGHLGGDLDHILGALRILANAGHIERKNCRYQLAEVKEPPDAA